MKKNETKIDAVKIEAKKIETLELEDLRDVVGGPIDGESTEGGGGG